LTERSSASHIAPPSERQFGLSLAAVFIVLAARFWWLGRLPISMALLAAAAGLAIVTISAPRVLERPNHAWFVFGLWLSRVVSPVVIGAMFLLVVTPVGILMRLFGHDPLHIRSRAQNSYWITRDPPGPAPESFHHQF
jgi:hypothetical protein